MEPPVVPRPLAIAAGASMVLAIVAVARALAPPSDAPATASWRHGGLHSRYAQARLRLAETMLAKAEHLNAHVAGQVSETDMRGLRSRIDLLREEEAETERHPHGYGFTAQRQTARAAVALAERDLEAVRAVNGRTPGTIESLDVRIKEERLDIARLRAEIWDDPAFLASRDDVLQMQIDQLADQLQDVLHDVDNAPAIQRR